MPRVLLDCEKSHDHIASSKDAIWFKPICLIIRNKYYKRYIEHDFRSANPFAAQNRVRQPRCTIQHDSKEEVEDGEPTTCGRHPPSKALDPETKEKRIHVQTFDWAELSATTTVRESKCFN
jgi:hypothetical protein